MNFLNDIFSEQFIHSLGWTLVHSLWQGALIGFAIAIAMVFLHRYTAKLRYFINSLGLFVFAALALVTFASSYYSYSTGPAESAVILTSAPIVDAERNVAVLTQEAEPASSLTALLEGIAAYCREHFPLFVTLWLMGMLAMMLRFIGGYALVRRYKKHKVKPVMGDWEKKFNALARSIRVNRNVRLLESALVKVPMAIGYLKPVVLLPLGALNGVPAQQMEAILVHELAHIKRRDYLMNLIQSILEVIFFYHPVVWWLSGNIRIERENICDDIAITQTGNTMEFAKALTNIQEINLGSPALAAGLSGKNKNRLMNRIRRLTGKPSIQSGFAEGFIAASILLISLVGLSAAAMISNPTQDPLPEPLSFSDVNGVLPGIVYYSEPIASPDTTEKQKEKEKQIQQAREEYKKQQEEMEKAIEAEMKAVEEQMKAVQEQMEQFNQQHATEQYEKAMQAYEEAMKNVQFNYQGSTNWTLPHIYFQDGKDFFYNGDSSSWTNYKPGYFWYEGDSLQEIYMDVWTDKFADYEELMILREGELLELEEEMNEFAFKFQDVHVPYVKPLNFHYDYDYNFSPDFSTQGSAKRIITEELYEDDLIEHGREYIVLIGKKQMLINGEKQSRAAFKKYRRLVDSLESPWEFEEDDEFRLHIGR